MALTCPQCAAAMHEVSAEAITGYLIGLDQCPHCGGIWCDRWELYPVTTAAVERIDPVDQDALQQSIPRAARPRECPRCRARLFRFHDPSLPADACIERCRNCDGMWFNRGEMRRFKARQAPTPPPAPPLSVDQLVADAQVGELARRALSTPRPLPTLRALDDFDMPQQFDASATDLREDLKASAGWLIVRALMRLLLRV